MNGIRCVLKGGSASFRYTNRRGMAQESSKYVNNVPPTPPDNSSNTMRYLIMTFGVVLTSFIVMQPKNDYNGTKNEILEAVYKEGSKTPPN